MAGHPDHCPLAKVCHGEELEGVAQVVEWRQVQEYAALTDSVWLRRMNLVHACWTSPRRRWAKACAHVTTCE